MTGMETLGAASLAALSILSGLGLGELIVRLARWHEARRRTRRGLR